MTAQEMRDHIAEIDEQVMMADGFEDALLGYARQFNTVMALYDRDKCIEILMKRDGMTEEEAEEFFEFNVQGASVGEHTPAFAVILTNRSPDEVETC
jgi:hypothetical protein